MLQKERNLNNIEKIFIIIIFCLQMSHIQDRTGHLYTAGVTPLVCYGNEWNGTVWIDDTNRHIHAAYLEGASATASAMSNTEW